MTLTSTFLVRVVPLVTVAACALGMGVTAGADPGPPNFSCDATHHPAEGAVYKNFIVNGVCRLTNVSFAVTRNLNDSFELDLWENTHVTVGGNVNVDHAVLNMGGYLPHSPSSISIDGNVTVTGGDFNTGDHSADGTSPVSIRVGGNFTTEGAYNIILEAPTIVGRTNISDDHSTVNLLAGTFGPISIENFTDPPLAGVTISYNTIDGPVDVSNVTDTGTDLSDNTIHGDLRCSGDSPPPINLGQPNTVTGSETGQCAGL